MASELVAGDARSKEDPPVDPADAVVGEPGEACAEVGGEWAGSMGRKGAADEVDPAAAVGLLGEQRGVVGSVQLAECTVVIGAGVHCAGSGGDPMGPARTGYEVGKIWRRLSVAEGVVVADGVAGS